MMRSPPVDVPGQWSLLAAQAVIQGVADTAREAASTMCRARNRAGAQCRDCTMPGMGIFVDLIALNERQTNYGLELLCKANHDQPDESIWEQHPNPAIRRLVELFTQRGLMRLDGFRSELLAWLRGERHTPGDVPARPSGSMERWDTQQMGIVRLYLETLPSDRWVLDDYMMLVDWLVQRYLPAEDLRTEAEWLATRATLMGRVQANLEKLTAEQADVVLAALPATVRQAASMFDLSRVQRFVMDFARERAAENVRELANDARHRMRGVVAQHVEQQFLRIPGVPGEALQTKLFDEFSTLNRDWRRIAVTEAGEAQGQGYIASLKPGSRVRRVEQYRGVCSWCAKIDGRVMEVVDAAAPDKDGETQIWTGKTNVGRSAAPRKRVGNLLVEREPHERWWPASGVQHPHCRGRWVPVMDDHPGDDADFGAWLRQTLGNKPQGEGS